MESMWRAARVLLGLILRRPLVAVCVIPILADGRIVLMRRRDSGLWGLPGGLVDWGETLIIAAQRELKEETGLTIADVGRLVGVYSAPQRDERFHSMCVAIEVFVEGTPTVSDPEEVLAVSAFTWDDLKDLRLAHDHHEHIADYLANRTVIA